MTIRLVHSTGDQPPPDQLAWRLVKGGRTAEAHIRQIGDRRELRISVDDELLWSRLYERAIDQNLDEDASTKLNEFAALGWLVP